MSNFDIEEKAIELLARYGNLNIAKEFVLLKEEHENLLWEYKQTQKRIYELSGGCPWQK